MCGPDTYTKMEKHSQVSVFSRSCQQHYESAEYAILTQESFSDHHHSNNNYPISPNLLKCDLHADKPNRIWIGYITNIPSGEGWLYLAAVKGFYAKMIVCYTLSKHIETNTAPNALNMAYWYHKLDKRLILPLRSWHPVHRHGLSSTVPGLPYGSEHISQRSPLRPIFA